jgi:O-antigen/teichoic acid export membrane protein
MRLATKIAYNTIVQIISKIITTILGLLAVAVMARYLGPAGFGEYTTAFTFISFFAIIADLGLTLVTVQMISAPEADENKIVRNLLAMRFVSAAILLTLAPLVAMFFPFSESIKLAMLAILPSFIFTALNQILVGVFQKKLRMDKTAIADTVNRVIMFIGIIISIKLDYGLLGIMLSISAGGAASFILHLIFSVGYIKPGWEFDFKLWREVAARSWPLALTIIFNLLYLKTDTLILSIIKGQEDVGVYGASYKVLDILTTLPFMFAGVIMPIFTAAWKEGQKDYFKKILQRSFDLMLILAVPLAIGAQILSKPIMLAVTGKGFSASGPILSILMVAAALVFLSCLLSHVMVSVGKQKEIIFSYLFTAATSVAAYLIFIPHYSYFGAAAVTIYSELTITIFMLYYVKRYTGIMPNWKILPKAIAASLLMNLAIWGIMLIMPNKNSNLSLLITIPTAIAIYFALLYVLKGIKKDDLSILLKK